MSLVREETLILVRSRFNAKACFLEYFMVVMSSSLMGSLPMLLRTFFCMDSFWSLKSCRYLSRVSRVIFGLTVGGFSAICSSRRSRLFLSDMPSSITFRLKGILGFSLIFSQI